MIVNHCVFCSLSECDAMLCLDDIILAYITVYYKYGKGENKIASENFLK